MRSHRERSELPLYLGAMVLAAGAATTAAAVLWLLFAAVSPGADLPGFLGGSSD